MAVKASGRSSRNVVPLATADACGRPSRGSRPGTALRDGLERILRGRTGALIVLGYDESVEAHLHRRLRARRPFTADPAARAGQDGRRDRPRPATAPGSCGPTCS